MSRLSHRRRSKVTQSAGIVAIEQCEQRLYLSPVFDVDQDGQSLPLSDGIYIGRYLAGFRGAALGVKSVEQAAEVEARIEAIWPIMDIDGDDSVRALTDGVLLIRYLAGFQGQSLTHQAVNDLGTRTDPDQIRQLLSWTELQLNDIADVRVVQAETLRITAITMPATGAVPPSFSLDAAPYGATIDSQTGELIWQTSTQTQVGDYRFVVRVTGNDGLFDTEEFNARVVDELRDVVVTVDYFDSVWNHVVAGTPEPNEDYIRDLVGTLKANGADTIVVRSGALGLFHYQTELSYPIGEFDESHVDAYLSQFDRIDGLTGTDLDLYKRQRVAVHSLLRQYSLEFEPLQVFATEGQAAGLKVVMWIDLFDDAYPGYRSKFLEENPDAFWKAADGDNHPALISYAYDVSRQFRVAQVRELLDYFGADGIYLSTSAHSRHFYMQDEPLEYGFEKPVADEYFRRMGDNLQTTDDIDRDVWNDIKGDFMNQMYLQIEAVTDEFKAELWIGQQLGDLTGFTLDGAYTGPIVASYSNQTDTLIADGIADVLVVNDYEYTSLWGHPNAVRYWADKGISAGESQDELFAWAEQRLGDPAGTRLLVWAPISPIKLEIDIPFWTDVVTKFHFDGAMVHEAVNLEDGGFDELNGMRTAFDGLPPAGIPLVDSWLLNTTGIKGSSSNSCIDEIVSLYDANVQQVRDHTTDVYVNSTGIPAYPLGPFPDGNPSMATDRNWIFRIPASPTEETGTKTTTPLGPIGVYVNGVPIYNARDGQSFNDEGIWNLNAVTNQGGVIQGSTNGLDANVGRSIPVTDGATVGPCSSTETSFTEGEYHHHQRPISLMTELVDDGSAHSPIVGWSFDGFPVYGPYGNADPDGKGGVKRMESGYSLIVGTRPDPLTDPTSPGGRYDGTYIEDYEFNTGFDLDVHNGHFAVTPEYPRGTYHYHATINSDGEPGESGAGDSTGADYPYIVGPQYFGVAAEDNFITGLVEGASQVISAVPLLQSDDGSVSVEVNYSVPEPEVNGTTGLSLNLHYDANELTLKSVSPRLVHGFRSQQILVDEFDTDDDPNTTHYASLSWFDTPGSWPDPRATSLFTARFDTTPDFISSQVNFTGEAAVGFQLVAPSVSVASAALHVTESNGTTVVSEIGRPDAVDVQLSGRPSSNVVVAVSTNDDSEIETDTTQLTFTVENWDTPQSVSVRGLDDSILDGTSTSQLRLQISDGAASEDLDVDVDNLDYEDNVILKGTPDDDTIAFTAGTPHSIHYNETEYEFYSSNPVVQINAGAGRDSIILRGDGSDDLATLKPDSASLQSAGYDVTSTESEDHRVYGGGGTDHVDIFGSDGEDTAVLKPPHSWISGDGFYAYAEGFQTVVVHSSDGGDQAGIYDGPGDEELIHTPEYSSMTGDDFSFVVHEIDTVRAYATSGTDSAVFFDSPLDDTYVVNPEYAEMWMGDLYRYAEGFDLTTSWSNAGGNDFATLYDSPDDDLLVARFNHVYLVADSIQNHVRNFETTRSYSTRGGVDEVQFYDSTGSDRLIAKPTYSYIYNRRGSFNYLNYQSGFARVRAFSTKGGTDLLDQYLGLHYFFSKSGDWDVRSASS